MAKNKNLVTMVAEQQATGREVIGLIAESKVNDNKRYELKSVDQGVLTFQEIVPEDEDRTPDVIKIDSANAEAMRYVRNVNEKPAPQATLDDGKLTVNGNEIPTGTLEIVKLLGGVKGTLLVGVATPDENMVDVYRYDVQFDKFEKVAASLSATVRPIILDGSLFLIENWTEEVVQKDEDGKEVTDADGNVVTETAVKRVEVYAFQNGMLNSVFGGADYDDYDEDDYYDDYDEDVNALLPISDIRLVSQGDRKDVVILTQVEEDENGYIHESENTVATLFRFNKYALIDGGSVGTYVLNSADAEIYLGGSFGRAPVVTIVDDGQLLIRDRFGLKVIDNAEVVAAIKAHPYFCGTEVSKDDEERDVVKFVYASKDNEIAAFTLVNTDRGQLVSLC